MSDKSPTNAVTPMHIFMSNKGVPCNFAGVCSFTVKCIILTAQFEPVCTITDFNYIECGSENF